jgi:hypothetical protein
MILDNPVMRLVLKAISACGLIGRRLDAAASHDNGVGQKDSPFVLVGHTPDGRWGVFQRDFNHPRALFDEMIDACNYANELAKTRADSMVLIRKRQDSAAI